jgi:uncharacterized protein
MTRVLAVSDEVDEVLWHDVSAVVSADLIVACGDLPFDYLEHLMARLDIPLVFVPGNHDPDLRGYRTSRAGLELRAGLPTDAPWPAGAINLDGRIVAVAGLTLAGLGGCVRYREGPNQYTQRQFVARSWRLRLRQGGRALRRQGPVDLLVTHAPPRGVGDGDDRAHYGVRAFHRLVAGLRPTWLLHGHVHPYGGPRPDRRIGGTVVRNVVGWQLLDIEVPSRPDAAGVPVGA